MGLIQNKIFSLPFWIGTLTFGLQSAMTIVAINFWGFQASYNVTVFSKILLATLITVVIWRSKPIKILLIDKLVILFWSLWMLRLLYDGYLQYKNVLSHAPSYYFQMSIFFAIIPFFGGKYIKNMNYVKNGILYSSIIFCIVILIMFKQYIGSTIRLGVDEESISALTLTYISSLVIGYFIIQLLLNSFKLIYIIYIILAFPIFVLGASKGGVLVLVFSILVTLFAYKNNKLKYLIFFIVLVSFVHNADFFGMKILTNRFETFIDDFSGQSSKEDARKIIWSQAIENIYNSPIFGDSIEVRQNGVDSAYPHNIIIEAAMSTGFIGGLLLVIISLLTLKRAFFLAKTSKEYIWILVIYTQSFAQNMVTGNIYSGATWFWFMVGLVNYKYRSVKNTFSSRTEAF